MPLPQTQALVLNAAGQPCGIGEPGEVILRTPFRTLGYINAPQEMRARFVPDPFRGGDPDDLLYFTGDRGRHRADGALDVLGRLDEQLKIRGVRVEPGEVTAALQEHPAVQECVVLGHEDARGSATLVAHVAVASRCSTSARELRSFIGKRLPAALVLSVCVFHDELPKLPNGKVDRSALRILLPECREVAAVQVAPRTKVESQLAEIWQEVLGVASVGVHDDFFDVGGHSLKAMQCISRIDSALGVSLPLRQIFETPTVAELAAFVARIPDASQTP